MAVPLAGTAAARDRTDVQLDRSFAVSPAAPTNAPPEMVAAAAYTATDAAELDVFEISILRVSVDPGATWSMM
ncbi:MAG: hypothetical protein QOE16_931 [Microbacteriaceae bacterium]|jgi:hypothetical protein|nr:hypothetical protein [Microbacteriaceae bacterium]